MNRQFSMSFIWLKKVALNCLSIESKQAGNSSSIFCTHNAHYLFILRRHNVQVTTTLLMIWNSSVFQTCAAALEHVAQPHSPLIPFAPQTTNKDKRPLLCWANSNLNSLREGGVAHQKANSLSFQAFYFQTNGMKKGALSRLRVRRVKKFVCRPVTPQLCQFCIKWETKVRMPWKKGTPSVSK